MDQKTKKKNGSTNGNSILFPSLRNGIFPNRFFNTGLMDFDDFWNVDTYRPLANFTETVKEFKLDLSVPGLKKEDFKVNVEDGILTVSCEKEEESNEDTENLKRREFSYSSFSRSFTLPDNAKEDQINAKYDNGILSVTIPKKEESASKPKKTINVG
jgi:HSP20 family protein